MPKDRKDDRRRRWLLSRVLPTFLLLAWIFFSFALSMSASSPRAQYALLLFFGFFTIIGFVIYLERKGHLEDKHPRISLMTVRAAKFEIVDKEGRTRATLFLSEDGTPALSISDDKGNKKIRTLEEAREATQGGQTF